MVQLNRSMMERYEIADRRPQTLRAAIFGADQMMLGAAARLLDRANERGADAGAVCFTGAADALNAQDGMFTTAQARRIGRTHAGRSRVKHRHGGLAGAPPFCAQIEIIRSPDDAGNEQQDEQYQRKIPTH